MRSMAEGWTQSPRKRYLATYPSVRPSACHLPFQRRNDD